MLSLRPIHAGPGDKNKAILDFWNQLPLDQVCAIGAGQAAGLHMRLPSAIDRLLPPPPFPRFRETR